MNTVAIRANRRKLLILAFLVLLCAAGYMLVEVNFSNPKLLAYAMKIRTPKLIVMLITAFAIGGASIVFQSIINNTIVVIVVVIISAIVVLALDLLFGFGRDALWRWPGACNTQAQNEGSEHEWQNRHCGM